MGRVTIRFNGDGNASRYCIMIGPMGRPTPPKREFRGGDQLEVVLVEREDRPEVVDLTFPDGVAAYEVPRGFFTILVASPDGTYFAGHESAHVGEPTWGFLAHRRLGVPEWVMVVIAIIGGIIVTPLLLLGIGLIVFPGMMPDTVYSKGYSESAFKGLKVGMTTQQVEAVMGPPLSKQPGYHPHEEYWDYSMRGKIGDVYYIRTVFFKRGRLIGVQMELFYE